MFFLFLIYSTSKFTANTLFPVPGPPFTIYTLFGFNFFAFSSLYLGDLSSLNIEKYDEWKDDQNFIGDVMRFLDNVLNDFIENAPEQFNNATYSAMRERSVGLGVMGLHSYFQKKMIPLESIMSKVWNRKI